MIDAARAADKKIGRRSTAGGKRRTPGNPKALAVVLMVTETEAALELLGVTDDGVTLHIDWVGAPSQVNEMDWLKPPSGLIARVRFAG